MPSLWPCQANSFYQLLNRNAGKLLGLGLLALLVRHGRAWQRDRQAVENTSDPVPVPPPVYWPNQPSVSILVTAWNETAHLPALVASLQRLRYPNLELVLCAGGEDGTFALAQRWESDAIRALEQQPGEGKFHSLERCFRVSTGQIILLTDADCILNDSAFESLIYPLATGAERATTGRFRPLSSQITQPFVRRQWAQQRYYQVIGENAYMQFLTGANSALSRDLLADVWDQDDVGPSDDLYLALSIQQKGARIRFVPESCIETEFPAMPILYIRQQSRWRRVHLLQAQRFGQIDFSRHVRRTLAMESAMLLMPLATLLGRLGVVAWILSWASYALAHLRFGWVLNQVEEQADDRGGRGIIPIVAADFAASALALIETLIPKLRERW